jgi:hypothetical protein
MSATSPDCRRYESILNESEIVAWLGAHAVRVRVDIEETSALAPGLAVRGAPTLIAYRDGVEKERLRGLRTGGVVLLWLCDLERTKAGGTDATVRSPESVDERRSIAKSLLFHGQYEAATEHYVWLWDNIRRVSPHLDGVRTSFIANEIDTLVRANRLAEARFFEIRESVGAVANGDSGDVHARLDWIVLNSILGEDELTIEWFDRVKREAAGRRSVLAVRHLLVEPLKVRARWADLGRLIEDPLGELRLAHSVATAQVIEGESLVGEAIWSGAMASLSAQFRSEAADLIASLRAAGRSKEATEVWNEALSMDPSEEMETALKRAGIRYD